MKYSNMKIKSLIILLFVGYTLSSQNPVPATTAADRFSTSIEHNALLEKSLISKVKARNIGPTVFSGRVSEIAVHPEDPSIFYVAYASGGLWKTNNNGTSFTPIFDHEAVITLGAIAVDWENNIIYAGTGEVNSSRSSYAGLGMYKSMDDGKTWTHIGLDDTHHIGRIIIDPNNSNTLYVAALGHLYSANNERGVFKSTDGGTTWDHVLFVDSNSGAVDIVMDPEDSKIVYTAIWERERRAWDFKEAGSSSGIYKTTDSGGTWNKLEGGFPQGENIGRIGLDITVKDGTTYLYALLDNYNRRPAEKKENDGALEKDAFKTMSNASFLALDDEKLEEYLKDNRFPEKYDASSVKEMLNKGEIQVSDLATYLEDANRMLFDTPVIGAEVYLSMDKGGSWKKTHSDYINGLYNSYGYYFGQIRVSDYDPNEIVIMGVPILLSQDAGANWENINGDNVHVDHHALYINPNRPGHYINGNDGGINISYDYGNTWVACNSPAVGQFYYINVDNEKPYNVYGGTQDNGVWVGPSTHKENDRWRIVGDYPYKRLMGGDGMQVQVDNRNANTVYTGYQFGNYFRVNKKTKKTTYLTPKPDLGQSPYRWNWQSPILLSPHNQDILYMGSNMVLRSMDKGENFVEISHDLTKGGKRGDVAFGTLTTIDESKLRFGLMYTGSDDGYIYRTKDAGTSWDRISDNLPQDMWVSRVQASQHDVNVVYASLNGYRWDDFNAYVFKSTDQGETWVDISASLPDYPINVIKEDPKNKNLIYVGTDNGSFMSFDGGMSYTTISDQIPSVPVHDLVIQADADDLVIGTHGRSIYIVDLEEIRNMPDIQNKSLYVFDVKKKRYSSRWGTRRSVYSEYISPKISIPVYSQNAGQVKLKVKTSDNKNLEERSYTVESGLNYLEYDLSINPAKVSTLKKMINSDDYKVKIAENTKLYLYPGQYIFEFSNGKGNEKISFDLIDN